MERVKWAGLGERQLNGVGERCRGDRVCVDEVAMSSSPNLRAERPVDVEGMFRTAEIAPPACQLFLPVHLVWQLVWRLLTSYVCSLEAVAEIVLEGELHLGYRRMRRRS